MSGRFKLDENLPRAVEILFSAAGHEVETVLGERLGGEPDPNVIEMALTENRILVTLDADFADIRFYPPTEHPGIWILRPRLQSIEGMLSLLNGALVLLSTESASHRLWIVEPGRVQIHE